MNSVKESKTVKYFFHDMINIKNLDTNKIKIVIHNILIYHIGYVTVKDLSYTAINNVNPLYLIISKLKIH